MSDKDELLVFGTPDVARALDIQEASVRKIVLKLNAEGTKVGTKLTERAWVFTPEDIMVLKNREDGRGKWQEDGKRTPRMQEIKRQREQEQKQAKPRQSL